MGLLSIFFDFKTDIFFRKTTEAVHRYLNHVVHMGLEELPNAKKNQISNLPMKSWMNMVMSLLKFQAVKQLSLMIDPFTLE